VISIVGQEAYGANLQSSVRDAHAFVIVIDNFTTLDSLRRLFDKLAQISDERVVAAPICLACLDSSRLEFAFRTAASLDACCVNVSRDAAHSDDSARARAVAVAAPFISCVRKLRLALRNQHRDDRGVMSRFKSLFRAKRAAPSDASLAHIADTRHQIVSSLRTNASSSLDDNNSAVADDRGTDVSELAAELLAAKSAAVVADDDNNNNNDDNVDVGVASVEPTLFSQLVLCLDIGKYQTKIGLAIADGRLAADVSASPFVKHAIFLTADLFADRSLVPVRLEAAIDGMLPDARKGKTRGSMRQFAHTLVAFAGFYYHKDQTMQLARELWTRWPAWEGRMTGDTFAAALGVDGARFTFMNSRTASGWAFIERYGCGEHAGLIMTLGASAGVFGVWRGLMCFTRPRHVGDRRQVTSAVEREMTQVSFTAREIVVDEAGTSLLDALAIPRRFEGEVLARCLVAAAHVLEAIGDRLNEQLHVSKPSVLHVLLAGGDAGNEAVAAALPIAQRALRDALAPSQVTVELAIAHDPQFNDLRGLVHYYRMTAGAPQQEWIDLPAVILADTQMRNVDVATDLLALCRCVTREGELDQPGVERLLSWLVSRRLALATESTRSFDAHIATGALRFLLGNAAFLRAVAGHREFVSLTQSGALDSERARELCAWIETQWHSIAAHLLSESAVAIPALQQLVTMVVNTLPSERDKRRSLQVALRSLRTAAQPQAHAQSQPRRQYDSVPAMPVHAFTIIPPSPQTSSVRPRVELEQVTAADNGNSNDDNDNDVIARNVLRRRAAFEMSRELSDWNDDDDDDADD
jgi:hypothetical protein